MPMISIIMPVYNKEKYVEKSILSILDQSYRNFELIIIDDGSTDKSLEICLKYQEIDERIQVIHIDNGGVSHARNVGLDNAKGEYVLFIDSDDTLHSFGFENTINKLIEFKPDVIFSGVRKVDKYDDTLSIDRFPYDGFYKHFDDLMDHFITIQLDTGLYGCVSNKIVKRSIITNNNIKFNEEIKLSEDFDFFISIYSYINSCYFLKDYYLNYLQNAENSSTSIQLINSPDYYQQIKILMKEYYFVSRYCNFELDILKNKINDYFLYYIKENYLDDRVKYSLNKLFYLNITSFIEPKLKTGIDKLFLTLLKEKKLYILSSLLYIYRILKKIKHSLK